MCPEIFRAGIQSIDKGQMEASPRAGHAVVENHAQGDPAPQAFRRILPPLGSNAIASCQRLVAGFGDWPGTIWPTPRALSPAPTPPWEPYLTISLVHWVITFLLAQLVNRLERGLAKVIHINNLHKRFGDSHVLRGISCDIKPQEVVCIIGPSGSGKVPSCAA